MTPEDYWQELYRPGTFPATDAYSDFYPVSLDNGNQVALPVRVLPGHERAVASLILNQASFSVVTALAADLAGKLRRFAPEVVVGMPTLGLTLAAALAQQLGHTRYVPFGTSRKFWYRDDLAVPLSSITSPDVPKQLYADPRMLPLLEGKRVVLVDDVVSSGVSMAAGVRLLARCGSTPVALVVAMLQSERWREMLAGVPSDRIVSAFRTPMLERTADGRWVAEK
jgi:adenine/guanine phosphoribosyltransferase-like PRPP-binding protein